MMTAFLVVYSLIGVVLAVLALVLGKELYSDSDLTKPGRFILPAIISIVVAAFWPFLILSFNLSEKEESE